MVLICNNNILTIDQFHKNRCAEKNEILNIYVKMKYEAKEPKSYTPQQSEQFNGTITRTKENYSEFKSKTSKYDYETNKKAYNTAVYNLDTKYGHR